MFNSAKLIAAAAVSALLAHSSQAALISQCTAAKTIALTFDDAFQHPQLDDLLADLAKYQITATFFLVPSNDASFCESLKKILAGGHSIGNHTWNHDHVGSISASALQQETKQVEDAVAKCGVTQKMTLFRPPYLETGGSVMTVANQMGYDVVTCNVNSEDYNNIPLDQAWSKVTAGLQGTGGQGVILMHNWCYKSGGTKGIIQKFAETYKNNGYKFVSVEECAGKAAPTTTQPVPTQPGATTTQPVPTSTTSTPTPTSPATIAPGGALRWGQCGGNGWTGPTTCAEGTCIKFSDWYSQCQ